MWELRASLIEGISSSGCIFEESVSSDVPLVPNTVSIRFAGVRADDLVIACDLQGIWISGGAACSSGKPSPSTVLLALGHTEEFARETVRISFASTYSQDMLNLAGKKIGDLASRMQHK
jgi:cysteine desulfurase